MVKKSRVLVVCALCGVFVSAADAGVGLQYGGQGNSNSGQPYNFAVSTTNGGSIGQLNASSNGDGVASGEAGSHRRKLDILSLFQRPRMAGTRGFGGGGGRANSRNTATTTSATSSSSVGTGGSLTAAADDQSNGSTPVNSGTCYSPNGSGSGSGSGSSSTSTDDNSTTGSGTGSGDNSTGGTDDVVSGGGDPNPSVVPEPGSLALWSLAVGLLVSVTRRR